VVAQNGIAGLIGRFASSRHSPMCASAYGARRLEAGPCAGLYWA